MAVFHDHETVNHKHDLPLIGIYSCLLCEHRFSTKLQLNWHYRQKHGESIRDYEREGGVLFVWHPSRVTRKLGDFRDAYKRKE